MIYNLKRFMMVFFLCLFLYLSIIETVPGANPTIGEIILNPVHPAPKSEVTISTEISGGSVSEVRLIFNECNKQTGICYTPRNISMNKKSGNTYEAKITLKEDEVTSITYHIKLESDGKWIDYEEFTTKLSTSSGSSNDINGSPGFEIILLLFAITVFVLYSKKYK